MIRAFFALMVLLLADELPCPAQDTVTIPKSRLEELERKEAELQKLKGNLSTTKQENQPLKPQHENDVVKLKSPPTEPVITNTSPPISTLPALNKEDVVDVSDLANYYRGDSAIADQRFRGKTFCLRGEVASFEKPAFVRNYKVVFKTVDRQMRVVCDIYPPDQYNAVFTIKDGSQLVGVLHNQSRVPLLKVGDVAVIEGRCKGLSDSAIRMSSCELK